MRHRMSIKELTEFFEHIRYQVVYYPAYVCKVSSVSDEAWVKKIQCMLPLFDAEIMTSRINEVK